MNGRLFVLVGFAGLWMCAIAARLVQLQVYESGFLRVRAAKQQERVIDTAPLRGMMLDREGRELARSIELYSIFLAPSEAKSDARNDSSKLRATVESLASILHMDASEVWEKANSDRAFVLLKRRAPAAETDRLQVLDLPGVHLIKEYKRFYPKGALAATVIGFVDGDDHGQAGLERSYEDYVRGEPGEVVMQTDALRRSYGREEKQARSGRTLQLTIDESIQYFVEQELSSAVTRAGAKDGTAIVIQPATGEVLALASYPSFDPNDPDKPDWSHIRNRAAELPYEPGSVLKIVTYSAGIEEGVVTAQSVVDAQHGSIVVAGHTVRDSGALGAIDVAEAVERSNNVVAIKVGEKLGAERLVKYLRLFGFGARSDPDLPNEASGIVRNADQWSAASLGAVPIGYEVGVTPMQMAAAISTIANNGVYVQPHVVQKMMSPSGENLVIAEPQSRRVISAKTAKTMRSLLEGVVLRGTAKKARLNGYSAAGKTGTARKFDRAARRYSTEKYFASFVGLAPVNHPQIAVVVVIDEPKGEYHGGDVAAPLFQKIAQMVLEQSDVAPDQALHPSEIASTIDSRKSQEEDVVGEPASELGEMIASVADSRPVLDSTVTQSSLLGELVMPDLLQRGGRNAAELCAALGLKLRANGSGVVVRQTPEPGQAVERGAICYVELKQ